MDYSSKNVRANATVGFRVSHSLLKRNDNAAPIAVFYPKEVFPGIYDYYMHSYLIIPYRNNVNYRFALAVKRFYYY